MSRTSDPTKYQQWRERFGRYRICGQTVVEFCQAENVSEAAFYYWKRRLATQPTEAQGKATQPKGVAQSVPITAASCQSAKRKQRQTGSTEAGVSVVRVRSTQTANRQSPIPSASPAPAFQSVELLPSSPPVATIRLPNGIELEMDRDQLTGDSLLESLFALSGRSNINGEDELPC